MGKPGPVPVAGENRDKYLRVRLTTFELEKLDADRGDRTRSDFVRDLVAGQGRARGQ